MKNNSISMANGSICMIFQEYKKFCWSSVESAGNQKFMLRTKNEGENGILLFCADLLSHFILQ